MHDQRGAQASSRKPAKAYFAAGRVRKRFGQHFLKDDAVLARIVGCLGLREGEQLLEIGPGRGVLTRALHELSGGRGSNFPNGDERGPARYAAIEIDRDLMPALRSGFPSLELINADVLAFDFTQLGNGRPWRIVGNLPYNISSPLLFKLKDLAQDVYAGVQTGAGFAIEDMHFMLQKEMANRLAASPGGKAWGRLSIAIQCHFEVQALFDVEPHSFSPPPRVRSTFVRLKPRRQALAEQVPAQLDTVLRLAFSARRKYLANALKTLAIDWEAVGVDAKARPEQLSVEDFVRIAGSLE